MYPTRCFDCGRQILTEKDGDAECMECHDFAAINHDFCDDRTLDDLTYQSYLGSDHWQAIRFAKIGHAESKCAVCSSTLLLHVHHRKYPEERLDITPDMLVVLCKRCHEATHG